MKRCTNCNIEYDDGKMFCPKCGNPLISGVVSDTIEATGPIIPDPPPKGKKMLSIGLIIGGVIALGLVPLPGVVLVAIFIFIIIFICKKIFNK
ncbi:MAG: zinc-ribbon domain-containing protein [Blautia sp.]|nr:zinc-ribbon domain-containing protein [Lachnoclostridium sp.]MCM1212096.1 zinc-ribbon domain-containing protein [Blautia sp.]